MGLCQVCVSLYAEGVVSGESGGHAGPGKGCMCPEVRGCLIFIVVTPLSHRISPSHVVCLLKKQNKTSR